MNLVEKTSLNYQMTTLTKEQQLLYDRARFLGRNTQLKIVESTLLIVRLNGYNTELAKNAILLGVNIAIADSEQVGQMDVQSNFLVSPSDLGKLRRQVVAQRLQQINPLAKVTQILQQIDKLALQKPSFFDQFIGVSIGTSDFGLMQQWYQWSQKRGVRVACGSNWGFFSIVLTSLPDHECQNQEMGLNNEKINVKYRIKAPTFQQNFSNVEGEKPMLLWINLARKAQQEGVLLDAFSPSKSQKNQQLLEGLKEKFICPEGEWQRGIQFLRLRDIQFCPVYSVTGSIVSQQLIKWISGRKSYSGWLVYDSQEGYGQYMRPKAQLQTPL